MKINEFRFGGKRISGSLSNRIGEELLGEALTVVTQLMLLFDLREKYNQCD